MTDLTLLNRDRDHYASISKMSLRSRLGRNTLRAEVSLFLFHPLFSLLPHCGACSLASFSLAWLLAFTKSFAWLVCRVDKLRETLRKR